MKSWATAQKKFNAKAGRHNNLLVVDGLNLSFRWRKSKKPFSAEFVRTIQSLATSYGARQVIVLTDHKGSAFRKDFYPEYKAGRDEAKSKKTEDELAEDRIFFERVTEALELAATTFHFFKYTGVEADDLAGVIVKHASDVFDHIWLISTDGDWDTLLNERTSRYSYTVNKEYNLETMYEAHGVDTVDQFIALKAIQGDLGDSIRGVDGIGPKRGYSILREHGGILELLDALPLPGNQAHIRNLNNSYDLIERNIMLVDLPSFCEEAVEFVGKLDEVVERIGEIK